MTCVAVSPTSPGLTPDSFELQEKGIGLYLISFGRGKESVIKVILNRNQSPSIFLSCGVALWAGERRKASKEATAMDRKGNAGHGEAGRCLGGGERL